jgi:hypothetical protein
VVTEIDADELKLGGGLQCSFGQLDPATGEALARLGSQVSIKNDKGEREGGKGISPLTRSFGGW